MSDHKGQDYADWLTPERLEVEEQAWAQAREFERYAFALSSLLRAHLVQHKRVTITELGCGTGWVPAVLFPALPELPEDIHYVGVDRNPGCLVKARARNERHARVRFTHAELRNFAPVSHVVCAFAVLKHFRLDEWQRLFVQWFGTAEFAVFTVPLADVAKDDGVEHIHVWLDEARLQSALSAAGHEELYRDDHAIEPVIITRKIA